MLSGVKFIPRDQVDEARGEDGSNSSKRRKKDGKREKRGRKSSRSKSSSDDGLERIKEGSRRKKKWYSSDEYSSSSSSENEDRIGKSRKRKGVKESRKVDHSPDGGKESDSINEIEVTRKEMGLNWMLRPVDTSDKKAAPKVDAQPKEPAEEVKRVNPRELNPYLKDDGSGYPDEAEEKRGRDQLPKSSVVGDGGASWRLKALKRAEEQAARDGRKLDEVVEERWGSLGQLAVSAASHRAAPSRAHLHAIRSRQMRQKEEQRPATDGQRKQDIEKTPDRSYLKDVSVRHPEMRAPKVRDSLSWGKQKTPKVSANDAIIISSAASSLNKFANDGNFMNQVLGQTNDLGSSNAKLEVVSRADSSEMIQPVEGTVVIKEGMTANQLAAKALQLRLKGNHEEADKLRRPEISPAMLSLRSTLLSRAIRKKKKKKKTQQSKRRNKPRRTPAISKREQTPAEDDEEEGFNLKGSAPSHSYGVQPLGNLYFNLGAVNSRNPGLGNLQFLSDELVLDILGLLSASHLGNLAAVSKSFYVFANHEPIWRNLVLDELKGGFFFNGSWRSTYIAARYDVSSNLGFAKIRVRDFYSDYLFQSWLCANLEMKPEWLERDNIVRKRGITVDEFVSNFEEPNKPVLLEGCIDDWPALEKWVDRDYLIKECGDVRFSVGPVKMKLDEYFKYSDQVKEERPLYLFDPKFAEKVPVLDSDYEVPAYFREDLFNVLGSERPDYRWIIMGPAGSGSSFHIDPNSTSAWNAVIKGSKKWILFPPDVVPPGVHPSPDGAEVACPVSIIEWFMNFYSATKKWKKRPVECVCKAGEVIFVPNGWWHLVINLEESIAITQNYVSRRNLLNVLDFLKRPNASELVSGTRDRVNLHDKFKNAVEAHLPQGTIDRLVEKAEETKKAQQKKVSFWESLTDAQAGGFKFSF